jgi:hypothetical protein
VKLIRRTIRVRNRLDIPVATEDADEIGPRFIGELSRLATTTGLAVIDSRRVVAASLVGQELILIELPRWGRAAARVLHRCTTVEGERAHPTDLLDFDGVDRLATSNCRAGSIGLYRLHEDDISHVTTIRPKGDPRGFCHGVSFVPGRRDLVVACYSDGSRAVTFVSIEDGQVEYEFTVDEWRAKDLAFVSERRAIVALAAETATRRRVDAYGSALAIVDLDLTARQHSVIDIVRLPRTHVDSCTTDGELVVVNDQTHGTVDAFELGGDGLQFRKTIDGFSFPHAVTLRRDLGVLGVTNYGTSSLTLLPMASLR